MVDDDDGFPWSRKRDRTRTEIARKTVGRISRARMRRNCFESWAGGSSRCDGSERTTICYVSD